MQSLSVVLATLNEEKNILDCLDSVRNLADEIIVVDGESTDKTVELAKKRGAHVFVTENRKNFHINKQKAIDLATKDWILQLDADERISSELKEEIMSKIQSFGKLRTKSEINGYWIPRKNWFLRRFLMKGGQYPDYTLRLYRRGKGKLPQRDVHEQAIVEGKIGYVSAPILHYPYRNFANYISKWNRYNDFLAEKIREQLGNKNFIEKVIYGMGYLVIKPAHWFLISFFRHKGFMDYWDGFVFSFFSALRFPISYLKYLKIL